MLWRWRKGPWAKKCQWPLEAGKAKETNSTLEPPEGNLELWRHPDFSHRPILDSWLAELLNGIFVLSEAIMFVVLCYSSKRPSTLSLLIFLDPWGDLLPSLFSSSWILSVRVFYRSYSSFRSTFNSLAFLTMGFLLSLDMCANYSENTLDVLLLIGTIANTFLLLLWTNM